MRRPARSSGPRRQRRSSTGLRASRPRSAADHFNQRERPAKRAGLSRGAWTPPTSGAERPLVPRAHEDDVAALELELVGFVAGELRVQPLTVVANELDTRLEAEPDDAFDLRLAR